MRHSSAPVPADRPVRDPHSDFAPPLAGCTTELRQTISAAIRQPEREAVAGLLVAARVEEADRSAIAEIARDLIVRLRARGRPGGVEGLMKEYSLSSAEGIALMCLAEALLRIPDTATRDALIRDKLAQGDWRSHLGGGRSIFVNASTWALAVSRGLLASPGTGVLSRALSGVIKRLGVPVVRRGVDFAIGILGGQFVIGETIDDALRRARKHESRGFSYSYDMLGEAALTMRDAERYRVGYEEAIHAIGKVSMGRGVHAGPGISIKLSALHPRYERAQAERVVEELLPSVRALALLAKHYDIGFAIDAEESDRLELSLEIFERLALDEALAGWHGLGFVVQAYGKRAPFVIDWLVDLARRSRHRIMVRLVKGAYWDSEIKRSQTDGLCDYPVFTNKAHTDLSYIACARILLGARDLVFPQFATHNAQTVATIHHIAGAEFTPGDFEFQCLHGMGDALYSEIVGPTKLDRPCRIYAPVGTHRTLLAYLVRRLLENGANSSFVNRIRDAKVTVEELICDPVDEAGRIEPAGSMHPLIVMPRDLYPGRTNSRGLDLRDEAVLGQLSCLLGEAARREWCAEPLIPGSTPANPAERVLNPADNRDVVGRVAFARPQDVDLALRNADAAFPIWAAAPVEQRVACLDQAADLLEERMEALLGLLIREGGKSAANAVAEIRESVDFLRYYAGQAREMSGDASPLGPVACISPWNFPLAIFIGQIAAALAVGNTVLAKPAEETPLIAAQAVLILHEAGIPRDVLQLLPGRGEVGAALVAARGICGVVFTGSTEVAKRIQAQLAERVLSDGRPVPFIAETGGQNAMIVDSSALPEQVVRDVMLSAFDSAGQRCSALRILCIQEDIADQILEMLWGAMAQLRIGNPAELRTNIGPVIGETARDAIVAHIDRMRRNGHRVEQLPLGRDTDHGTFIGPTLIAIDEIGELGREVFGPVLHVLRYARKDAGDVLRQINGSGYGLTFGLHSRIEETVTELTDQAQAGNIYVNRNMVGAVVGVQPFGGRGLSGTGPKAGGPFYLGRLTTDADDRAFRLGTLVELDGPVGERNLYGVRPRGRVLALPATSVGLCAQLSVIFASGNIPLLPDLPEARRLASRLDPAVRETIAWSFDWTADAAIAHVLIEDIGQDIRDTLRALARRAGPIPIVQLGGRGRSYRTDWLLEEVSISTDTTAAGGNASLLTLS